LIGALFTDQPLRFSGLKCQYQNVKLYNFIN